MKHLLTFNESNGQDSLQSVIEKISNNIDINNLKNMLKPYSKKLSILYTKYSTNGIIDTRLIQKDITNFLSSTNEELNYDILTKILVRLVNLPINIVRIIINSVLNFKIFNTTNIIIAVFVIVLSVGAYQIGEHAINGISIGVVYSDVEFVPEHVEETKHEYKDSDGNVKSYSTYETIPDTWSTDVRASNDRIETWSTTDRNIGANTHIKDVVRITDWEWVGTKKFGTQKGGGGFSGGGTGESY